MRKKVDERDKSEIVEGHLNGLTRDEIVDKTGFSAGKVSGIVNEFVDYAKSSSVKAAAEKYDIVESVEKLRGLAVWIRKAGTDVEHLLWLGSILDRVKKITSLENLEKRARQRYVGFSIGLNSWAFLVDASILWVFFL